MSSLILADPGMQITTIEKQLTLQAADKMAEAAIAAAEKGHFFVSVVVADATGRALVQKTMPGAGVLAPHLARAKANAVISFGTSTRAIQGRYADSPGGIASIAAIGAAGSVPISAEWGGVVLRDPENHIVAAIAVAGAGLAVEDEHCAIAGATAIGSLKAEPAESSISLPQKDEP